MSFDQFTNENSLFELGMGIKLDFHTATKDKILNAISTITNDSKFLRNAKLSSEIFRSTPMTPEQKIVYWTEHILKYNGATFMKAISVDIPWYQYYIVDGCLFSLAVITTFSYATFILFKFTLSSLVMTKQKLE